MVVKRKFSYIKKGISVIKIHVRVASLLNRVNDVCIISNTDTLELDVKSVPALEVTPINYHVLDKGYEVMKV